MYATLTTRFETVVVERAGAVAYLTLDRPEVRNAMNFRMIQEIRDFFLSIREDRSIRCIVLRGGGETFCAGADIKELQDPAHQRPEAQEAYATVLDEMLLAVQHAPQVTVAAIEGAAMGGGLGLLCVADIAIADESAVMALPEVRLGLVPSVVSPYVIERIGLSRTRQLALTGRRLGSHAALEIGLLHDVVPSEMLDELVESYVEDVLQGAPEALAATKALLFHVAGQRPGESRAYRVEMLSRRRSSAEGEEGMTAFAQKRRPYWAPDRDSFPL